MESLNDESNPGKRSMQMSLTSNAGSQNPTRASKRRRKNAMDDAAMRPIESPGGTSRTCVKDSLNDPNDVCHVQQMVSTAKLTKTFLDDRSFGDSVAKKPRPALDKFPSLCETEYSSEDDHSGTDLTPTVDEPAIVPLGPCMPSDSTPRRLVSLPVDLRKIILLLLSFLSFHLYYGDAPTAIHPNSVYVPGGGFSGFWFTIGQLKSIENPQEIEFHCYSAGCLGVVSILANYSMNDMLDKALDIQERFQNGHLGRYEVVGAFVDELMAPSERIFSDPHLLSRIHIITTVPGRYWGVSASTRQPRNAHELRTMLLQTTWIPFVVGHDLWYDQHMDGAFSVSQHPPCARRARYPFDLDVMVNTINVHLGRAKVEKFWNAGLKAGL